MSAYFGELCRAMELVARHPRSVFVGQAVAWPGTAMTGTLKGVPQAKRLEFPVAEDMQLGFCVGASLRGDLPVCIYPRWSFLLLAMSQLVLHLDKLPLYSDYRPKVIIRTAVPTPIPIDPGPQHLGDFTEGVRTMLHTVAVVRLDRADEVVPRYQEALDNPLSTLLVERTELYE